MLANVLGVFCVIDEVAIAITKDGIARRRGYIPVDQPEVAVLSEEEKILISGVELSGDDNVNER
jgi:hypothetical protein